MAVFVIMTKQGEHHVYVSDRDVKRVTNYARFGDEKTYRSAKDERDADGYPKRIIDYSRPLGAWHIVWKKNKIVAVATNVYVGPRLGTKLGRRIKQVKLHEFIMGEIPHCKGVRHRDGDPLNNTRENLALYQLYYTENFNSVKKSEAKADICDGCKNENTCRKVPTRKRISIKG